MTSRRMRRQGLGAVAGDGVVDLSWTQSVRVISPDTRSIGPIPEVIDPNEVAGRIDSTDSRLGGPASTYRDTSVVNGTEYFYVVTATDDDPAESVRPMRCRRHLLWLLRAPHRRLVRRRCCVYESDAGVSDSSGTVSGWADQSGQGNDVTAAGDPQVGATKTPRGDAVSFDGAGDWLEQIDATDTISVAAGAADRTMFVVANSVTITAVCGCRIW